MSVRETRLLFADGTNHEENVRHARARQLREPFVHGDPKTFPEIKRFRTRTRSIRKTTPRPLPNELAQSRKAETVLRGRVEVDEKQFRSRRDQIKSRGNGLGEGTKRYTRAHETNRNFREGYYDVVFGSARQEITMYE